MRFAVFLCFSLLCAVTSIAASDQPDLAIRPKAPTGEEVTGDLWLFTIGINTYQSWPRLNTATNDANSLKKALLERYHIDQSRVIELYDENATRKNIIGMFRYLSRKVKPDDSLLIFYAGHGHIDSITNRGSWIPVESSTDDPSAWLSNQDIKDYLNIDAIKAKHVLLVSDSCFSGDFFRGTRGALPIVNDAVVKKAYQLSSRQAITSGGLEPVSDAGFGGNSVFSYFLVKALKNNTNPFLIPSELFPAIKSGVAENSEQFPQMGSLYGVGGQEGGELVLFLKQEKQLEKLAASSAVRQIELDHLKKMETEIALSKQKEQAEIALKQAELDLLEQQITEMKARLFAESALSSDSLDAMVAMVERKEQQAKKLEELRFKRESEELKQQIEIDRLQQELITARNNKIMADIAKYQKVTSSTYGQELKSSAWDALVASYPEARNVAPYDVDALLAAAGVELTYSDPESGLMWPRNGNIAEVAMNWYDAVTYVKQLKVYGYNDWRLPTNVEFETLASRGGNRPFEWFNANGFNKVEAGRYWSATDDGAKHTAIFVDMSSGKESHYPKSLDFYVWPVRSFR